MEKKSEIHQNSRYDFEYLEFDESSDFDICRYGDKKIKIKKKKIMILFRSEPKNFKKWKRC